MINLGPVDKIVRVIAGIALLSLIFVGPQTMWGLVGLVPLLTGVFNFCPMYKLFGINRCKL